MWKSYVVFRLRFYILIYKSFRLNKINISAWFSQKHTKSFLLFAYKRSLFIKQFLQSLLVFTSCLLVYGIQEKLRKYCSYSFKYWYHIILFTVKYPLGWTLLLQNNNCTAHWLSWILEQPLLNAPQLQAGLCLWYLYGCFKHSGIWF